MENTNVETGFWSNLFKGELENSRLGLIAMLLLVVGCLGGITVGLGAINNMLQLILVVVPTMTALSLIISVAPMKYIMTSCTIAIVIDIIILLVNAF